METVDSFVEVLDYLEIAAACYAAQDRTDYNTGKALAFEHSARQLHEVLYPGLVWPNRNHARVDVEAIRSAVAYD